jgi:hypothetical protein
MGLFDFLRQGSLRRKLIKQSRSLDWGVAESAIRRIPGVLESEAALRILLPLSRGEGGRLANSLRELPATPTCEFTANVHISSAIEALGKIKDPRASARLLEILSDLPHDSPFNFPYRAFDALGSPNHRGAALRLAALASNWSPEMRRRASSALWRMQTEEAFEAYMSKFRWRTGPCFLRKPCEAPGNRIWKR